MTEVFIGAIIGFFVLGYRGIVIGAALGWFVGWLRRNAQPGGSGEFQSQFIESTFAVMGAVCKADSVVTADEIRAAESLFDRLRLSGEQREAAKAAFNRGKSQDFDVDGEVARFATVARGRVGFLHLFLQVQLMAVGADGRLHPAEHAMLVRIAHGLGLTGAAVAQLEALLRTAMGGAYAAGAGAGAGGAPARDRLADAFAALGLEPSATDSEVKRAYRHLMNENHPDKLAARGLPESMREVAEERSREINTAYQVIKAARPGL